MAMSHEHHNQGHKAVYNCNSCKSDVEARYHCTVCSDFDLCIACYEKEGHPHEMEKFDLDLGDGSSPDDQSKANSGEPEIMSVDRCIQLIVHASECKDTLCRFHKCRETKMSIEHVKSCKRKVSGECPLSKLIVDVCYRHANECRMTKCPVPFCFHVKRTIQEKRFDEWLRQTPKKRIVMLRKSRGGEGGADVHQCPYADLRRRAVTLYNPSGGGGSVEQWLSDAPTRVIVLYKTRGRNGRIVRVRRVGPANPHESSPTCQPQAGEQTPPANV